VQPQLRNPIAVDEYLVHVGISSRVDANSCESMQIPLNILIVYLQIDKLDSSSPLPPSVVSIRHEERRVLENAKIRIRSFNDDPAVPVPIMPKTNILMIAPYQDIQCMVYDVWGIIEDLLNDGDHPDHAVSIFPRIRFRIRKQIVLRIMDWRLVAQAANLCWTRQQYYCFDSLH